MDSLKQQSQESIKSMLLDPTSVAYYIIKARGSLGENTAVNRLLYTIKRVNLKPSRRNTVTEEHKVPIGHVYV